MLSSCISLHECNYNWFKLRSQELVCLKFKVVIFQNDICNSWYFFIVYIANLEQWFFNVNDIVLWMT